MSVLIKGMEMPKAGNWKTIRIYYDGTCAEPNWQGDCKYMRGCEAVPVPDHGRLIDADALMMRVDLHGTNKFGMLDEDIRQFINAVPTIIPADLPVMYYPQVPGITPTVISDKEGEG